jgi:hypothetical protein
LGKKENSRVVVYFPLVSELFLSITARNKSAYPDQEDEEEDKGVKG